MLKIQWLKVQITSDSDLFNKQLQIYATGKNNLLLNYISILNTFISENASTVNSANNTSYHYDAVLTDGCVKRLARLDFLG